MTTFTSITVIVFAVAFALLLVDGVLAVILIWTARRVGDSSQLASALDTLRTRHRNLDELFESYRKRDAQRVSTAAQRRQKDEKQDAEELPPAPLNRDDIVSLWERQR